MGSTYVSTYMGKQLTELSKEELLVAFETMYGQRRAGPQELEEMTQLRSELEQLRGERIEEAEAFRRERGNLLNELSSVCHKERMATAYAEYLRTRELHIALLFWITALILFASSAFIFAGKALALAVMGIWTLVSMFALLEFASHKPRN